MLTLLAIIFSQTMYVCAETIEPSETANSTILIISDPETGEEWEWMLSDEDINVSNCNNINEVNLLFEEVVFEESITIDVTPYIVQTMGSKVSGSSTLDDDITITTGLTYSSDSSNNTVSIYKVFGSTSTSGNYYASNRTVYWRNPGAGVGDTLYPTTNTWSYDVDSTAGAYYSSVQPYSLLDCEVHILDMSAYRTISVKYSVSL